MAAVVPEDMESDRESEVAIQKMMKKNLELRSAQILLMEVETLWILEYPCDSGLRFVEKPIGEFRPAFSFVIVESLAQILLNQAVVDDLHRSASQFLLDLVPRPTGGWIFVQFSISAPSFRYAIVVVCEGSGNRGEKFGCQARPLCFGQFHRSSVDLFDRHLLIDYTDSLVARYDSSKQTSKSSYA